MWTQDYLLVMMSGYFTSFKFDYFDSIYVYDKTKNDHISENPILIFFTATKQAYKTWWSLFSNLENCVFLAYHFEIVYL